MESIQDSFDGCIVAIGNPDIRERLTRKIKKLETLIHPRAIISNSAAIGNGCVVEANAVINSNVKIMDAVFVCAGAVVNHNAVVRSYSQVDCNAVVGSGAVIPEKTKVMSCTVWNK